MKKEGIKLWRDEMNDKDLRERMAYLGDQLKLADKNHLELKNTFDERVEEARLAGVKEVVEWVETNNRITPQVNENRGANIPREVWQAKLKEWGIE